MPASETPTRRILHVAAAPHPDSAHGVRAFVALLDLVSDADPPELMTMGPGRGAGPRSHMCPERTVLDVSDGPVTCRRRIAPGMCLAYRRFWAEVCAVGSVRFGR